VGCRLTGHPVVPADLGVERSAADLAAVAASPGPVELETVIGADWSVPLSGLLDLDHERARAAGLRDGPEPIHIYFHALRHPEHGLFIVDTGVERALADPDRKAAIRGLVAAFMDVDSMRIRNDTASWLGRQPEPLAGVFMTHLHLDHVSGLPDVPDATPIYAGPGETGDRSWQHVFVGPNIDRALAGKGPVREWAFGRAGGEDTAESGASFEGVIDVFGDGSVWALHVPGHTPGSTAYLVRTPDGPVLLVGDASHSAWGWSHDVEPGTFSSDGPRSAESLARLRAFAAAHPEIEVRLGHQPLHADRVAAVR
jgi:glyoxylase-like metal-dependent hydrolase (beta-lactamase superfamily II)